jgi:hypothetical protein
LGKTYGQASWEGLQAFAAAAESVGEQLTEEILVTFIVVSEYLSSIGSNSLMNEAVTRRYRDFCADDFLSARCFNGFWGYMQGTHNAEVDKFLGWINPKDAWTKNTWDAAAGVAHAVLNPNLPNNFGITKEMNSCLGRACDWATIIFDNNGKDAPNSYYTHVQNLQSEYTGKWELSGGDGHTQYFLLLTVNQVQVQCGGSYCNLTEKTAWP